MATYLISGFASYVVDTTTGVATLNTLTSASATLDDQEADTTFEVGDALLNYTRTPSNDFLGTIEISLDAGGTLEVPVVRGLTSYVNPNVIEALIVIPPPLTLSDVTFPTTFDYNSIDTTDFVTCFAAGTHIETDTGEVPVDQLSVGDLVRRLDGTLTPVRWIGRQTVVTLFRVPERVQPIRVRAGALGDNLPRRDLVVTSDHGLYVDGFLINAGALVNGTTIAAVPLSELGTSYTVYHVETEKHEIILAEGAPTETYVDYTGRQVFDNYREYIEMYGEERVIEESPTIRISAARLVPRSLVQRLAQAGIQASDTAA